MWESSLVPLCTFLRDGSVTQSGSLSYNFSMPNLATTYFLQVSSLPISFGTFSVHYLGMFAINYTLSQQFLSYSQSCFFFVLATFHGCFLLVPILGSSTRLVIFQGLIFKEGIVFHIEFMILICIFTIIRFTTLASGCLFVAHSSQIVDAIFPHNF